MKGLKKCLVILMAAFFASLHSSAEWEIKTTYELNINDAVELAVSNNLSIKEKKISLDGYERKYRYSWNSINPSISASASYSKPVAPSEAGDDTKTLAGTISLSISPSLYTTMKTAKLNYENGKLTYDTAVRTIELSVRKAFYKLLYEQDNIKLQKQNLESAKKQYDQNLQKYNQGGISRLDVLSAQVSYENQKPKVLAAETAYENDLAAFRQSLGLEQKSEIKLKGSLDELLKIGEISIEDVIVNSPEIAALEKQLEIAKTSVLANRFSAYGPTIAGTYRVQNTKTGNADDTKTGSVSVSVTIPLDGWLPWSSDAQTIANAKDNVKTLELQLEDEKTTVAVNTESYLRSIEEAKATIKSLEASVDLAQQTYDMTLTAYSRGTKDLLSLQTALDNLLEAQVNLKSEAYTLISNILDLENALGIPFGTLTNTVATKS